MVVLAQQRLTVEAFLRLPEAKPALELGPDGMVSQKVSPKARHSTIQTKLPERLNAFAEPRRLARALTELRTTFGGASFVPDVAVYRWERIPLAPDGRVADDVLTPPDIAVEIISPGQRQDALVRKCQWYVDHGVQVALLVDPEDESIRVLRAGRPPQVVKGAASLELADVLPGLELTAEQVFEPLRLR